MRGREVTFYPWRYDALTPPRSGFVQQVIQGDAASAAFLRTGPGSPRPLMLSLGSQ